MSDFDFDPTKAEPSRGSFPAIPGGKYVMQLLSFDEKDNNNQTGKLREGVWEVVTDLYGDATYAGAIVYENINTHHDSGIAQRIGREQLSAICVALCPGQNVRNSDQLLGKTALNTVKFIPEGTVDKGKSGRADYTHTKDKNEITAHAPVEGGTSAAPAAAPAAPAAPRAAAPPRSAPPASRPAAAPVVPAAVAAAAVPAWRQPRAAAGA